METYLSIKIKNHTFCQGEFAFTVTNLGVFRVKITQIGAWFKSEEKFGRLVKTNEKIPFVKVIYLDKNEPFGKNEATFWMDWQLSSLRKLKGTSNCCGATLSAELSTLFAFEGICSKCGEPCIQEDPLTFEEELGIVNNCERHQAK